MATTESAWARSPLVVLAMALTVASCESSCDRSAKIDHSAGAVPSNGVAARVNGLEISSAQLDQMHKKAVERMSRTGRQTTPDIEKKMRGTLLLKLIDEEILKQKAKEKGVELDRFERVAALEQYKARIGGPKAYEALLRERNLTEEQMLDTLVAEQIRDKVVEKISGKMEASDSEIKAYYDANKNLYMQPEMVKARHILLKLTKDDPAEKAELVLKKANQILQEARVPGNSFESLVQKYSDGPSAKNGGDLGFFPRGRMVKSFEDAAFNAPPKTPIGPIQTDFGYHIIYVDEKSLPKEAPLDSVKERISDFVKRTKKSREGEKLLSSLRKSADVKVYDYAMTQDEYKNYLNPEKAAALKKPAENENSAPDAGI